MNTSGAIRSILLRNAAQLGNERRSFATIMITTKMIGTSSSTKRRSMTTSASKRQDECSPLLPYLERGSNADVIVSDDGMIRRDDLRRLMSHKALGIHVKNFYDRSTAKRIGSELEDEANAGKARNWRIQTPRGMESSDVSTLGEHVPYNVANILAQHDEKAMEDYFDGVQRELSKRRRRYNSDNYDCNPVPFLWPLDKLRLELDEAWPNGASLARNDMQRCFGAGLPRIIQGPTRWKNGFIHIDDFSPLSKNNGLFSANIYLRLPKNAKEGDSTSDSSEPSLLLWPLAIHEEQVWNKVCFLNHNFCCESSLMGSEFVVNR